MRLTIFGGEPLHRLAGLVTAVFLSTLIAGLCLTSIMFDLGSDAWHPNAGTTYRLLAHADLSVRPTPPSPYFPEGYPDAIRRDVARVRAATGIVSRSLVASWSPGDSAVTPTLFVDSAFPGLFDFGVSKGDLDAAARDRGIVLLTSTAKRWFGTANAVGRPVRLGKDTFRVIKVIGDPIGVSHLPFEILVPLSLLDRPLGQSTKFGESMVYANLASGVDRDTLKALADSYARLTGVKGRSILAQRLPDIVFTAPLPNDRVRAGGGQDLLVAGALAVIVLLGSIMASCMLIAAMLTRQRQTLGVLLALGGARVHVWGRAMREAGVLIAAAAGLACVVGGLLAPSLMASIGKAVSAWRLAAFLGSSIVLSALLLALFVSVTVWRAIRGSVAAAVRPRAVETLSDRALTALPIALQVAFCFAACAFALAVSGSVDGYIGDAAKLGRIWRISGPDAVEQDRVAERLHRASGVADVVQSDWTPFLAATRQSVAYADIKRPGQGVEVRLLLARDNAPGQFGSTLRAGRWATPFDDWQRNCGVLLNATAVERLFRNPNGVIGHKVIVGSSAGDVACRVVGVTDDVRHQHIREALAPEIYATANDATRYVTFRADPGMSALDLRALALGGRYSSIGVPQRLIDVATSVYQAELRSASVFRIVAAILFGLMLYTMASSLMLAIEARRVEIGVRRALGAPWNLIGVHLARPFLVPAVIGIAGGFAGYAFLRWAWMRSDAMALQLGVGGYVSAGLIACLPLAAALAIGWRLMTAVEPAEVLRAL